MREIKEIIKELCLIIGAVLVGREVSSTIIGIRALFIGVGLVGISIVTRKR